MPLDDDLHTFRELWKQCRYEEAAAMTETFTWQLVAADRIPEALQIIGQVIEKSEGATTLFQAWSRVGQILYDRRLFDRARGSYLVALEHCDAGNHVEQARVRHSIANTYLGEGKYEDACRWYRESFALSETIQYNAGIAENAIRLTDALKYLDQTADAQQFARRAVTASVTAPTPVLHRAVEVASNLARWLMAQGRPTEADELLQQTRTLLPKSVSRETLALLEATERELRDS